jgi:hypothetical protein
MKRWRVTIYVNEEYYEDIEIVGNIITKTYWMDNLGYMKEDALIVDGVKICFTSRITDIEPLDYVEDTVRL